MDKNLTNILSQLYGTDILRYDETFVMNSILGRIAATNCQSAESYMNLLRQDTGERAIFSGSLQNSYSEFFRNTLTFSVLEKIILHEIVLKRNHIKKKVPRLWSAACAAGQEAFSLAMLMEEIRPAMDEKFQYMLFASDRDELSVKQAQQGKFTSEALNNVTFKRLQQWFSFSGKNYTVNTELINNIQFSVYDLLDERWTSPPAAIYGGFDLIICSNLLFYYDEKFRKTILGKISNCLAEGGYLITGEAERDILMRNGYQEVYPQSCVFIKQIHL